MAGGLDRYAVARTGRQVLMQVSTKRSPNRYLGGDERPQIFASMDGRTFEELPSLRGMLAPSLSADGKWVTYESYERGEARIFLERFRLEGRPMRAPGTGYEAVFSAKGDKLFYRVGTGIMQVPLHVASDSVTFGEPQMWVRFDFADFMGRSYKVGADERVLVKLLPSTMPQREIRVVTAGRGA